MSITTTYTCDRCGHEQKDNKQMWDILIAFRHNENSVMRASVYEGDKKALWCRACAAKFPILASFAPKPLEGTAAPTLEETIREIIREELESAR